MLIRFICENFSSFNDEVEFSMLAGKTQQHKTHVVKEPKSGFKILKSSIIYGANASGKSNLIKAISFARKMIIDGSKPKQKLPYNPFRLDNIARSKPSKFEFEFRTQDTNFNYGFKADANRIHAEWLYNISATTNDLVFERVTNDNNDTSVKLGNLKTIYKTISSDKIEFLKFTAKGTRPNQLFLTDTIDRNIELFDSVYSWFKSLVIVFPNSRYTKLEAEIKENVDLKTAIVRFFKLFDIGISDILLKEHNFDTEIDIPKKLKEQIVKDIESDKNTRGIIEDQKGKRVFLTKSDDDLKAFKLVTLHKSIDSMEDVEFDISEESDGTRRLLDLIPGVLSLFSQGRVLIVDELDRSLHPHLSRQIVEFCLSNFPEKSGQLIVTTHESSLLDLDLVRRDEIWFVEKKPQGVSQIYSLEEFAPRYDKDIRKGYLLGRFGAIPLIKSVNNLHWIKEK